MSRNQTLPEAHCGSPCRVARHPGARSTGQRNQRGQSLIRLVPTEGLPGPADELALSIVRVGPCCSCGSLSCGACGLRWIQWRWSRCDALVPRSAECAALGAVDPSPQVGVLLSLFAGGIMRRAASSGLVLALGALCACAPVTARSALKPAPPSTTTPAGSAVAVPRNRLEIADVRLNSCNGESVLLEGEIQFIAVGSDPAAGEHLRGHFTGVGNLGNGYILNLQAKSTTTNQPTGISFTSRELLISKGSAPNQLTTFTLTFPPLSVTITADCRGGVPSSG